MPINNSTTYAPDATNSSEGKVKLANHLAGTSALPQVVGVEETSGPTSLLMGAVSDGQQLQRSGTSIIGTSPMDVVGGRLDAASTTSLIWNFQTSNQIRLYNPTSLCWEVCNITTAPTSSATGALNVLGATQALAVAKIYDVFAAYNTSTAFNLEFSPWAVATAGASARSAAWAGSSHAYVVGDRVSSSSVYYVCVEAHSSNTFATELAAGKWVSCGAIPANTDFTGLYQADGIWVSGNSPTQKSKRWLGIIYTFDAGSSVVNFKDDVNYRYVSNYYNRKIQIVLASEGFSGSWTCTSTDCREMNAGTGITRGNFITCASQTVQAIVTTLLSMNNVSSLGVSGLGLNTTTSRTIELITNYVTVLDSSAQKTMSVPLGYSWITLVELVSGGTLTNAGWGRNLASFYLGG